MMITIKHKHTNKIICEFAVASIKEALELAYLRNADLQGADLQGADLQGADLQGADLQGAYLRNAYLQGADLRNAYLQGAYLQGADLRNAYLRNADLQGADLQGADLQGEKLIQTPLVINNLYYWCLISDSYMRLGCRRFTHTQWSEFTNDQINAMDSHALEFWRQWKAPLLAMCEAHSKKL